jgi:pimeloyl-ACP methyl ester carboxylesterase
VLTTVRNLPIHEGEAYYQRIAERGIPTRIIWGRDDLVTPIHAAEPLRALFGEDSLTIQDGVGHLPFVEAPLPVAELLASHFRAGR